MLQGWLDQEHSEWYLGYETNLNEVMITFMAFGGETYLLSILMFLYPVSFVHCT